MADLLTLDNLSQIFGVTRLTYAVDGITFRLPEQPSILNLVGESGSGKSTLARMVLRLQKPTAGRVAYRGQDIFAAGDSWLRTYRREVQGVFQNPYSAFNPFYRVERVFTAAIRSLGLPIPRSDARQRISEALRSVDLRPEDVLGKHPHQLSGGMRQRVMMARIHLIRPRVVVADEPVSMVDAGVRASFLNILLDFRDRFGISTLFITHDLSTAQYLGGDIIVLYKGRIVEQGPTRTVTVEPLHPYAQLLVQSIPIADPERRWTDELKVAPDSAVDPGVGPEAAVPDAAGPGGADVSTLASGAAPEPRLASRDRCLYAERCPHVMDVCWTRRPALTDRGGRHVACYLYR